MEFANDEILPGAFADEIRFDINTDAPRYRIQFDVLVHSLEGGSSGFGVTFQGDDWFNFGGYRGGRDFGYQYHNATMAGGSVTRSADYWTENVLLPFTADVDLADQSWRFHLGDTLVEVPRFESRIPFLTNPGEHLRSIDIFITDGRSRPSATSAVSIDNIVISAIPEPATSTIAALGVLLLGTVAIRRSRRPKVPCHPP